MESSCIANRNSLHNPPKSSEQTSKPRNIICDSLDELIAFCDDKGRLSGSQQKKRAVNTPVFRNTNRSYIIKKGTVKISNINEDSIKFP